MQKEAGEMMWILHSVELLEYLKTLLIPLIKLIRKKNNNSNAKDRAPTHLAFYNLEPHASQNTCWLGSHTSTPRRTISSHHSLLQANHTY